MCQKEGGLFASFVDFSITFSIMSDKHRRGLCLHVHIESNICGLGTIYECSNVLNLAPLY